MNQLTLSFSDELEKIAKYPISKLLTSRGVAGGVGAGAGIGIGAATGGGALPLAALMGARGAGEAALGRIISSRGMAGRLRRGGKGLMKHDIKRLAEATGSSEADVLKAIASMGQKGGKTNPISRFLTAKYNPLNIPGRMIGARGMAGRALDGPGTLMGREGKTLSELGDAVKKVKRTRALKRGGAAAGGAATLGLGAEAMSGGKGSKKSE